MKTSLCLLTWNELEGCKSDVPLLPLTKFDEVYAIDGGSTDGTVEYLESKGVNVYKQDIDGYNGAYITAFNRCTTDGVIFFHPKGSIDPLIVIEMKRYIDEDYDLVIASRMEEDSLNEEDGKLIKHRKWFVLGLALFTSLLWRKQGPIIWDVLHGFRGMKKSAFLAIKPLKTGLAIDLEMILRGYKLGLSMIEFPVEENTRIDGETHFKAWPTGKKLLKYLLWEILKRTD